MIPIETTKNYALPKWKKSDFIQMDDFNDAFAKLDTALKAEADARAAADSTASKALSALEQTVTKSKLCRIKYGSYTGNGKTGKANPNTLSCDFYPVLLIVSTMDQYSNITRAVAIRGVSKFGSGVSNRDDLITWNARGVSWYPVTENDTSFDVSHVQLNASGVVYQYLLFGYDQ